MQTGFISGKRTQEEEREEGKATKQAGQSLQFKGKCAIFVSGQRSLGKITEKPNSVLMSL